MELNNNFSDKIEKNSLENINFDNFEKQAFNPDKIIEKQDYNPNKMLEKQAYNSDKIIEQQVNNLENTIERQAYNPDKIIERSDFFQDKLVEEQAYNPDRIIEKQNYESDKIVSEQAYNPDKIIEKQNYAPDKINDHQEYDPNKIIEKTEVLKENSGDEKLENFDIRNCPISDGEWIGERGNSKWIPNADYVPQKFNPDNLTWKELMDKYSIDGIPFNQGEVDFSEISKGDVKIDEYTDNRNKNFVQADIAMAEERGCSPQEVAAWRYENGYTWHELKDCQTMLKVPREIHGNITHRGGISEILQMEYNNGRNY